MLFQFHREPALCAERLTLLREMNPGAGLFAVYGGPAGAAAERTAGLRPLVDDLWAIPAEHDARWRWANTDLVARRWYRDVGCRRPFDRLAHVQWDLVLAAPLADVYARVPASAVGLTAPVALDAIADRWAWTTAPELAAGTRALLDDLAARGHAGPVLASLGPGSCLPRAFLERYVAADVPDLGHDEIRLPAWARLLGCEVADTGFYPAWFDAGQEASFHANDGEIAVADALAAARRGRRAFHPCRESFRQAQIAALAGAVREGRSTDRG